MNSPKIGGIVKAEAIATISLKKKSPKDVKGKDFFSFAPNL